MLFGVIDVKLQIDLLHKKTFNFPFYGSFCHFSPFAFIIPSLNVYCFSRRKASHTRSNIFWLNHTFKYIFHKKTTYDQDLQVSFNGNLAFKTSLQLAEWADDLASPLGDWIFNLCPNLTFERTYIGLEGAKTSFINKKKGCWNDQSEEKVREVFS